LSALFVDAIQFGIEKAAIEAGIVSNQMVMCHKRGKILHNLCNWRGAVKLFIGYTCVILNKAADPHPRIHQALKAINNLVVLDENRSNLNGPVTIIGRQTGCFKIENDNAVITHTIPYDAMNRIAMEAGSSSSKT
jgi:hypothetical protein